MTGRRLTRAQRVLVALHGTPEEFSERAMRAIGNNVTPEEAIAATRKYRSEFEAAGSGPNGTTARSSENFDTHQITQPVNQNRG